MERKTNPAHPFGWALERISMTNTIIAMLKMLHHSWKEIGFDYFGLTELERLTITEEQFNSIVKEMKLLELQEGNDIWNYNAKSTFDSIHDSK